MYNKLFKSLWQLPKSNRPKWHVGILYKGVAVTVYVPRT
jgi:hypothetical protein